MIWGYYPFSGNPHLGSFIPRPRGADVALVALPPVADRPATRARDPQSLATPRRRCMNCENLWEVGIINWPFNIMQ